MTEVPRVVSKMGDSWIIKLDPQTRKLLNITEVGQTIILKEANNEFPSDLEQVE